MNMFKKVKARSVDEYFESLPADRRKALVFLHRFIRTSAPKLRAHFATNMPGYGSFKYTDYKKRVIDWPIIALASQKNYISVYVCSVIKGEYVAERHKHELGKVSVGRSCIRFKKIDDLNLVTFKKVITLAARYPGLVTAGEYSTTKA